MNWAVTITALAAVVLAVAATSTRLTTSKLTTAMAFVAAGLLLAPLLGSTGAREAASGEVIRVLAEATLTLVLFADASRLNLRALRHSLLVPTRMLAVGLPLTIAAGALLAWLVLPGLNFAEGLVLAVVLAPTDAALGQAVISDRRVPLRIRQGLNVESGLNDGISVPLLFIAIAAAEVETEGFGPSEVARIVGEEVGFGVLAGILAGALVAIIVKQAGDRGQIAEAWRGLVPLSGAALSYGMAAAVGGSGFVAAFVAGVAFTAVLGRDPAQWCEVTEDLGQLLGAMTFIAFGAVLLGPALGDVQLVHVLYAILSLTLVRMVPVAISMLGTGARLPTLGFLGWFGPRGLASIVFAVLVIQSSNLPAEAELLTVTYLTVGFSVLLHGLTAVPLAARYGDWAAAQPTEMEDVHVPFSRTRGPRSEAEHGVTPDKPV